MKRWTTIPGSLAALLALAVAGCAPSSDEAPVTDEEDSAPPATAEAAPGFKFMVLVNKQDEISFEEFESYFFETHLPYVLEIPGLRGYKVNLRHPDDEDAPYDGITEFWFDDRDAYEAALASPETEATLADAENFLEPPQILLVDERVIMSP